MVYGGKPSKGCSNCKKAHTKCDEARPSCSLCIKRKLVCPGYQDDFDLVLRDQTSVLQNKKRRHVPRKQSQNTAKWTLVDCEVGPQAFARRNCHDEQRTVTVPQSLPETIQQIAMCYFFSSYILVARYPDTCRGFLEYLLPLYQNSETESTLSIVTSALSLIILNGRPGHRHLLQPARKAFGKALAATRKTLQNPTEIRKDETLISVLLMGFAEGVLSIAEGVMPTGNHALASVTLVRIRGEDNFKQDISRRLFTAVRAARISHAVELGELPETLPEEQTDGINQLPVNNANKLSLLEEEVAVLKADAKRCLNLSLDRAMNDELLAFLERAVVLDQKLVHWVFNLPSSWKPLPVDDVSPNALKKFQAYKGIDVYSDLWVLSLRNLCRLLRLDLQKIFIAFMALNPTLRSSNMAYGPHSYIEESRRLVDEICAGVPFSLGNRQVYDHTLSELELGKPLEIEYPWVRGSSVTADHRRGAYSVGGWFYMGPLSRCLELDIPGCPEIEIVKPAQKEWVTSQLRRIRAYYGIDLEDSRYTPSAGVPAPLNPPISTQSRLGETSHGAARFTKTIHNEWGLPSAVQRETD